MSQADKAPGESVAAAAAASRGPPKACSGCSGLLPRPKLLDLEDMGSLALEKLVRQSNMARQLLAGLMRRTTASGFCNELKVSA